MTPEQREKQRAYSRKSYAKHRDKKLAYGAMYRAKHPEVAKFHNAKRYAENPEAERARCAAKRNRARESERDRKRYWENVDAERARNAEWRRANPDHVARKAAARRAVKKQAFPSWANPDAIAALYAEARRLTESTGIPHHVDHIVPLVSPVVCGLHCEANLQVLPAFVNLSKSNRYWPGMPE